MQDSVIAGANSKYTGAPGIGWGVLYTGIALCGLQGKMWSILRREVHVADPSVSTSSGPLRSKQQYWHYAWLIAVMAAVLQVSTNFVSQAFAVLLPVIQNTFGWSLTAITLAYFFKSLIQACLSPVAGMLGDRYGARRFLLVGACFHVAGLLLLSTVTEVWQLYLYFSLVLGVAQAMFQVNIPTTVAAWFRKKLGVATGLQQSLGGMGASIMAPVLALLLGHTAWKPAFWIITVVGGAVIFGLLFFFHSDPESKGARPYGADGGERPAPARANPVTAKVRSQVFMRHVRRTKAFWNLMAIHHLGCLGHAIIMVSAVHFAETKGVPLAAAAWIVSIYSLASVGGRFCVPILADRFGAKGVMALFFFLQGISVLMLFWAQEAWQFYLFAFAFGTGLGGEMSAFIVINRQYFGTGPVRTVFGFQSMGAQSGMAVGGLMGSVIFDLFGSYNLAWMLSIGASLAGVVCILLLEPTSRMLVPHWEEDLPPEARSKPVPAAAGAD
ncbi:MAG: MFS transporter [SAR202 cluster bacterium]|nr:MFS transporter [SAR202 cluster bacterium]